MLHTGRQVSKQVDELADNINSIRRIMIIIQINDISSWGKNLKTLLTCPTLSYLVVFVR